MKNMLLLRNEHAMSQQQLANLLSTNQQSIAGYETGKNQPDLDMIIQIADVFHTSVDFLIGHISNPSVFISNQSAPLTLDELHHLEMLRRLPKRLQAHIKGIVVESLNSISENIPSND